MFGHHQIEAIKHLVSDLIPGCVATCAINKSFVALPIKQNCLTSTGERVFTQIISDTKVQFHLVHKDEKAYDVFSFERSGLPFTKLERGIFFAIPHMCRGLTIDAENNTIHTQQSISSQFSMPYLLILQFMRGTNPSCLGSSLTPLCLLQKLSYSSYEGSPCSSGFLCLKKLSNNIAERINTVPDYTYNPFAKPIPMSIEMFEKPLSYRYVDGKNSFYVIDNQSAIHGIIRVKDPKQFDIIDRCSYRHIESLKRIPGFRWMSYSGMHNDVILHAGRKHIFHWDRSVWRLKDASHLEKFLSEYGVNTSFAKLLISVVFSLSELRHGTLILILDNSCKPDVIGKIDTSPLGNALCDIVLGSEFSYCVECKMAIGLLSSDGLTTFDKAGKLIGCGEIIDLTKVSNTTTQYAGGGRSQAACAASAFGVTIKVSEDGPISLFYQGKKVIEWK